MFGHRDLHNLTPQELRDDQRVRLIVVTGGRISRKEKIVGVIAKEHVADSVVESIKPYAAAAEPAF